MKNLAAAAFLACVIPGHVFAQDHVREPAQDVDQIRRSVRDGQKVIVTDNQGRLFKGKIDGLAGDSLTIVSAGTPVDVPYAQILRIQRRGDTVIEGALIGFVAGSVLGYVAALPPETDCTRSSFGWSGPDLRGAAAVLGGGIGAAAGIVIDRLIPGNAKSIVAPEKRAWSSRPP